MSKGAVRENPLRALLASGDRKEIGEAPRAAREILDHPSLLDAAIACLRDENPVVVSHPAHALMQVSRDRPELFSPHADLLCDLLDGEPQWEIGEQLPKILSGLALTPHQALRVARILTAQIDHKSNIAAASALSALVALARTGNIDARLADAAISAARASPRKALAARARRLANSV